MKANIENVEERKPKMKVMNNGNKIKGDKGYEDRE